MLQTVTNSYQLNQVTEENTIYQKLPIRTRLRILNTCVLSVLTYRNKTWIISTGDEAHKEAAEMRFLRRMLRIPRRDNESNDNVLNRALVLRNIC